MSRKGNTADLSRRERQIMDALYRLGNASAAEIRDEIPNPPSYTAVRTLLTILQEKGHLTAQSDGTRHIYSPIVPREEMAKSVIRGVLDTFFDGSIERVVATLLDKDESQLSPEQLDRLAAMIEQARQEEK